MRVEMTVPLTVEMVVSWLRRQEPDEEYIWSDPVFCLMGRYLADHGSSWGAVDYRALPHYEEIAQAKPWTYGAALERAERLALPPPVPQIAPPVPQIASASRELVVVD
jgi:hypothetical protein